MRERRLLQPVERHADQSVFIQESETPVLLGREADGFDYLCGVCGRVILVENVVEGEIYDIVIRCAGCGGLSATPARPVGHPLPKRTAIMQRGEHVPRCTYELTDGYVLVGAASAERYLEEVGDEPKEPLTIDEPESLEALVEELRTLLGPVFDKLEKSDRLAQANGPDHERYRHPLMVRVTSVRNAAAALRRGKSALDLVALTDLNTVIRLYQQFSRNPAWETIRRGVMNPRTFVHDVINLAFAAVTANAHNGVGIQENTMQGKRLADLLIAASSRGLLAVEVKTPNALQDPTLHLIASRADEIVRDAFRSADTGMGGQLNADRSGLLVLGALRLAQPVIGELHQAVQRKFAVAQHVEQHIFGVVILSFSHEEDTTTVPFPLLTELKIAHPRPALWNAQINLH